MQSILYLVALTLSLLSGTYAAILSEVDLDRLRRIISNEGLVRFPVQTIKHSRRTFLPRRQEVVALENKFTGTSYVVSCTVDIGSNNQTVVVLLDTGSSELWVNPDCSTAPSSALRTYCAAQPRYDPVTSTSAVKLDSTFSLRYGTGSASGNYYVDDISCGTASVRNQQFGVASTTKDFADGILGLGLHTSAFTYPSFIEQLASQGETKSVAFSLDLRPVKQPTGSVIFGGIDTKKYKCNLSRNDIIPASQAPDGNPRYWIYMTGVGQTPPSPAKPVVYPKSIWNPTNITAGLPVFLDSGGTLTRLPKPLFEAIAETYPSARFDSMSGMYMVDCNAPEGTVDFSFGDKTIHVPYEEFIWEVNPTAGNCALGMLPDNTGDGMNVLGDSFLRGAVVVYDIDNQELWLDEADDCGTNLRAIGKGPNAVPQIPGCQCQPTTASSRVLSTLTRLKSAPTSSSRVVISSSTSRSSAPTSVSSLALPSSSSSSSSLSSFTTAASRPTSSLLFRPSILNSTLAASNTTTSGTTNQTDVITALTDTSPEATDFSLLAFSTATSFASEATGLPTGPGPIAPTTVRATTLLAEPGQSSFRGAVPTASGSMEGPAETGAGRTSAPALFRGEAGTVKVGVWHWGMMAAAVVVVVMV